MKKSLLVLAIAFTFQLPLSADQLRIAVMDFESRDVPEANARLVSELIRTDLANTKRYDVVERVRMTESLVEQGLPRSGCGDIKCAVEAGRKLYADKVLFGTVVLKGKSIVITGHIVDVESGFDEYGERQVASLEENLPDVAAQFADRLAARIGKDKVKQFVEKLVAKVKGGVVRPTAVKKDVVEEKKQEVTAVEMKTDEIRPVGTGSSRHLFGIGGGYTSYDLQGKGTINSPNYYWIPPLGQPPFDYEYGEVLDGYAVDVRYFYTMRNVRFGFQAGLSSMKSSGIDMDAAAPPVIEKSLENSKGTMTVLSLGPGVLYKGLLIDELLMGTSIIFNYLSYSTTVAQKALGHPESASVSGYFMSMALLLGYELSFNSLNIDIIAEGGPGFSSNTMRFKNSYNKSDYMTLRFSETFIFRISVLAVFPLSLY
jgi:hypothetical protein